MQLKSLMIITLIIISLLAVSTVNASENVAIDVVGVDATDEVVSLDNNNQVITEGNVSKVGSFSELETEINTFDEGSVLNLTKDYKYVNGSTEGITITKSITIDGQGHIIDGNCESKLLRVSANEVVLKNIVFKKSYSSSTKTNGAIYWGGDNGVIKNCTFKDISVKYGIAALNGYGNNISITDCNFINNTADVNSVLFFRGTYIKIINCTFTNNYAGSNSDIYVRGPIYLSGAQSKISNCSFINNSVSNYAGALHVSGDESILTHCCFINNSASCGAGAVYWSGVGGILANCTFINNSGIYGSALSWNGADGLLANCTFINNTKMKTSTIYWSGARGLINNTYFSPELNSIYNMEALDLIITKRNSLLICENISFEYDNPINFTVYLNHSGNITINMVKEGYSKALIYNVNEDGILKLYKNLFDLNVGIWNLLVIFEGNDNYAPCNATATITVLPPSSSLTIDDVNTTVGHEITLVANVNSSLTVNEGVVTFFDGETNIGESPVSNGTATLTYTPTAASEHNITAIFNSGNYLSSNKTAKLLVDSATIVVLVNQGIVGFNSTFVAEVKGLYSTINEGTVTFYINDEYLGSVPVVNASASITYIPLNANTYTVKAIFGDSDKFLNDEDSDSYTVVPADSIVSIGDMNGTVGYEITINVGISSSNNLTINEGHVIFFDGSTQIGESDVFNGIASLTYTPATAGEHPITAMYYGTNYEDNINSALLNVSKAEVSLSINNIAAVYFSNPSNFIVDVISNSHFVNEGNVKYYVNNRLIGSSYVYGGKSIYSYVANGTGLFDLEVVFEESDNFLAKNASATFGVDKMPTTLTGESVIFDEQEYKTFTTELKDYNTNGVNNQTVRIELIKYSGESATFTGISDGNGITFYDVGTLAGGMWYVSGTYNGNENYIKSSFADKFIVVRLDTTTEIEEIQNAQVNHNYKLKANIHDENGKLVKEGILQFYLDGVDIGSIDLSNNQGHQSALGNGVLGAANPMFEYELGADDVSDLYIDYVPTKAGKHTLTAVYEGTTIYKASNQTTTFDVKDGAIPTEITTSGVTTVYNGGQKIVILLKDAYGNKLDGVKVTVKFSNGAKVTADVVNGKAKVSTNGLKPVKKYTATITFNGNAKYEKSTAAVKVKVNKATPKITAKAKTFKRSDKKKLYAVKLLTNQNKVMKYTNVYIKVNNKLYTATTNKKGIATFSLNKLTKKGKYTAKIIYKESSYYTKLSKNVKIAVK